MFGPEDHVSGPDLQDGQGLEGRGNGKQGELRRRVALAVALPTALPVEELESTLEIHRLERAAEAGRVLFLCE